jgi:alpha-glucosidase (family GH31 glycosyl hydrolase)
MTTVPTYEFLKKKNGRPFIISRSNSVGTGAYAGHWTGDNVADWDFLRLSISGNFLFQIFGIQMVGADICGFHSKFYYKYRKYKLRIMLKMDASWIFLSICQKS